MQEARTTWLPSAHAFGTAVLLCSPRGMHLALQVDLPASLVSAAARQPVRSVSGAGECDRLCAYPPRPCTPPPPPSEDSPLSLAHSIALPPSLPPSPLPCSQVSPFQPLCARPRAPLGPTQAKDEIARRAARRKEAARRERVRERQAAVKAASPVRAHSLPVGTPPRQPVPCAGTRRVLQAGKGPTGGLRWTSLEAVGPASPWGRVLQGYSRGNPGVLQGCSRPG